MLVAIGAAVAVITGIGAGNIFRVNIKEQIPPRSICAVTASQYETPEPVQRFIDSLLEKESVGV